MGSRLTHIYTPNPGGVSDYVNVCILHEANAIKHPLEKLTAFSTKLSGNCLLHYSGYGYEKRGVPLWLLNKLEVDRHGIKTLGIFFHELYAFAPPWSSAFWLSPVQRHIASCLVEMSDFWITNRENSALWLRRIANDKPHAVLPVFSNVGEMPSYSPNRAPKIVVFGGSALRQTTYNRGGETLFAWAHMQGLEIHDIGPPIDDPVVSASLRKAGVILHGRLTSTEASRLLADASFGVVAYPVEYVAKSGVFAAYCAHGVCPVLLSDRFVPSDGLAAGAHYLAGIPAVKVNTAKVESIGSAAWEWYQPHRVASHVSAQQILSQKASNRVG